jgi:hypothetical protein
VKKKKIQVEKTPQPRGMRIDQQKRDRVAAVLGTMAGLLTITEGGRVLLGLSTPPYTVLPWLVWYNVVMAVVSVAAGAGIWMQRPWSIDLGVNILAFHAIVFAGLVGMQKFGQPVAMVSIFAMLFRTFIWIIIVSLVKWKRQDRQERE